MSGGRLTPARRGAGSGERAGPSSLPPGCSLACGLWPVQLPRSLVTGSVSSLPVDLVSAAPPSTFLRAASHGRTGQVRAASPGRWPLPCAGSGDSPSALWDDSTPGKTQFSAEKGETAGVPPQGALDTPGGSRAPSVCTE